jgi:hypothetical protein
MPSIPTRSTAKLTLAHPRVLSAVVISHKQPEVVGGGQGQQEAGIATGPSRKGLKGKVRGRDGGSPLRNRLQSASICLVMMSNYRIRLIRHTLIPDCGSYEVRFPDGRESAYFYWDDNPGRRSITFALSREEAEQKAKGLAWAEQDELIKKSARRKPAGG